MELTMNYCQKIMSNMRSQFPKRKKMFEGAAADLDELAYNLDRWIKTEWEGMKKEVLDAIANDPNISDKDENEVKDLLVDINANLYLLKGVVEHA